MPRHKTHVGITHTLDAGEIIRRANAQSLFIEGNERMAAGNASGAEESFRAAVRIAPDFAEAYANLGLLLDNRGAVAEAEICYRRSLRLNPNYAKTHLNLGGLLAAQKRHALAEAAYKHAIALSPHSPAAWSNLGVLYACIKREEEAERCYRKAIELDASYDMARFNFSYLLLRQGRFEEGWRFLESRKWYAALAAYLTCPRWQGEDVQDKSILIGYEAGHGDMIQFCRYAAALKAQGAARITLMCHPALKTLFATLEDVDEVVAFNEPFAKSGWDYWTPPLSIPYFCNTRIDTIPAPLPYLHATPENIAKWAPLLPAASTRVGLVWKGNPRFENDADRSIPRLEILVPLADVPGVSFVSLQKGAGEDEALRPPSGLPLTHLGSRIENFADTAAIVANLDLVISVDTAIAHLAGAMAKPCWVLLPDYKPDWRWFKDRTDSPWYPRVMRLFRQREAGSWDDVIAKVSSALKRFVVEPRSH